MKRALTHRGGAAARTLGTAAAAAVWLVPAGAALHAQDERAAQVEYREVRPEAGTGQRGLLDVPAWLLWSFGAALIAAAAWVLWSLFRGRERSAR
jgi:hypothetical protein